MKNVFRVIAGALLATAALAVPSAALAAEPEPAPLFGALTERDSAGKSIAYPIHQGETVPVVLGVTNYGTAPSKGVVVNIRVVDDLELPRDFTNCRYYVDSNLDGAWCEFDQELPVGGTYALTPVRVSATAKAEVKNVSSVVFHWLPKDFVDNAGGIDKFAARDSGQGTTPTTGTAGVVKLEPKELPVPKAMTRVGFAYLKLIAPSASPSTTAPSSPVPTTTSSSAPAAPAPTEPATGAAGGLPITGSKTAVFAGIGAVLVVAGFLGFLVARRRTKFVA
jgi:LPXTG-motif cell wall-anchored protein